MTKTRRSTASASFSRPGITFKTVRITILLVVLFFVAMDAWLTKQRTTDWDHTLRAVVYPINGDGSITSSEYIHTLREPGFDSIEGFMSREADRYQVQIKNPVTVKLAPVVTSLPPKTPPDGNMLNIMWWSLRLRYWAYVSDTFEGLSPDVKMFVVYYDPKTRATLDHSIGLEEGLIGVAKVFADRKQAEKNNVVIMHEMLHTIGATDKYNLELQPVYPDGYAEPSTAPRFPQKKAEIMGGRIPISQSKSVLPKSLRGVVIGETTGKEIRWVE